MGILKSVSPGAAVDRVTAANPSAFTDPSRFPIVSPFSADHGDTLHRLVFEDIFGSEIPANTRQAAMSIPAVARARNLLCSTIAKFPLVRMAGPTPLEPSPWMLRAGNVGPQHRVVWTVDDLIFYGWSCWWRVNDPETGFPVDAIRLNQDDWEIDDDNRVIVHGTEAGDDDVIVIPGFHEGILSYGRDAIADARSLYRNVRTRLNSPIPPIDLHQTGGRDLTTTERRELIDLWIAARKSTAGAVGFTTKDIEVRELGAGGEQLMIEERNAAAVEMARIVGVHAGLVDATTPKASLNYETATGRNQEFVDFDLDLYLGPIRARLSLDDVMPAGESTTFELGDFTGLTPSSTGPTRQD